MIGFFKLSLCVSVYFLVLDTAECQVTVSNLNGAGKFLCGHRTLLECAIPGYLGGMAWKLDGTIIAQCAFGSCTDLNALPSGDIFTYDETAKTFNLNISITHADNGTMYQCDDGLNQDQTTVNIQVPPSESAFTTDITETNTSITVEAGCFYPSDAGRMDVYCVTDGNEVEVEAALTLTPTTTGCAGVCAGPNIYTATRSYDIKKGGNSIYRFKMYHKDFKAYAITNDSTPTYNCVPPEPPEPCKCECECRISCLVFMIIFPSVTCVLVGVFCQLNKGPFSDKIRCYIAGSDVVTCLCVVIGMTVCLFSGCEECECECCTKPCPIAGTVVGWVFFGCAAGCYIFYLVKSKQLEWLSCGFCQVEPSCETKHAREPQHSNQPGKDKFARNGNNDKGRENASRTNAPRPQPAPPMKDPSETSDSEVSRKDVTLEHGVQKRPLPGITKDKASRGLSATFDDQFDHMPSFESKNKLQPLQPNSITEEDEQKKKKKKKKRKNDETM